MYIRFFSLSGICSLVVPKEVVCAYVHKVFITFRYIVFGKKGAVTVPVCTGNLYKLVLKEHVEQDQTQKVLVAVRLTLICKIYCKNEGKCTRGCADGSTDKS